MNGELARRASAAAVAWQHCRDVEAAPLTRALAKRLGQVQGEAILHRAQIEAEEQNTAFEVDRRMANGYLLGSHLVQKAGKLSHEVTNNTKENPGLEMIFRAFEENLAGTCQAIIIQGYMKRQI